MTLRPYLLPLGAKQQKQMNAEVCSYLNSHEILICEVHGVCCVGRGQHLRHLVGADKSEKDVGAAVLRFIYHRFPSLANNHPCDSYAEFGKAVKDIIDKMRSSDREPWCKVEAEGEHLYVCGCNKGKPKKKHHFLEHIRKGTVQKSRVGNDMTNGEDLNAREKVGSIPRCPWSLLRQPEGIWQRSEDWEEVALRSCQVKSSRATCGFTSIDSPSFLQNRNLGNQNAGSDASVVNRNGTQTAHVEAGQTERGISNLLLLADAADNIMQGDGDEDSQQIPLDDGDIAGHNSFGDDHFEDSAVQIDDSLLQHKHPRDETSVASAMLLSLRPRKSARIEQCTLDDN